MTDRPQESDIAFIRALAELLRETDLTEIEVNRELGDDSSLTVRVARQIAMAAPVAAQVPPQTPAVQLTTCMWFVEHAIAQPPLSGSAAVIC